MSNARFIGTQTKIKGEPFVWLTSMGLALGLLMVSLLLGVIAWYGLKAFWPANIASVEMNDGTRVAGVVVMRREKSVAGSDGKRTREWQLFTGNKDAYSAAFRFIEETSIKTATYPEDLVKMERTSGGFAVGRLHELRLMGQDPLLATAGDFEEKLKLAIHEAEEKRETIEELQKVRIGQEINAEIEERELTLRKLARLERSNSPDAAKLRSEIKALQAEHEVLNARAQKLIAELKQDMLILELVDGNKTSTELGQVIRYNRPNSQGVAGKLGVMLAHMWHFVSEEPREANTEGGIFPAIFGTFVMTVLMSFLVTPFGVIAAVYMHEYAKQGPLLRILRIAVNNLAGVPSIVFGVFGLGFFVYVVGAKIDDWFFPDESSAVFGTSGMLWASLTLALLTLPVVIVATEEALSAVPRGLREASLAIGASQWQTIYRIIIPASLPGIITGMILAMARGAGEVAPLMMVGVVKHARDLPINGMAPFVHLDQKFMHLGFHIYDLGFQSPDSEAARPMVFATTVFLIALVIAMNMFGIIVRERLRGKYAANKF